jgi:DNA-binding MarR family transcriptional regulator
VARALTGNPAAGQPRPTARYDPAGDGRWAAIRSRGVAAAPAPIVGCSPVAAGGVLAELIRTANLLRRHVERTVLRRAGLTWTSFDVLQVVCWAKRVDARAVTTELGIAKATLSGVVDALAGRGFLTRWPHEGDRRRVDLYPTVAGMQYTQRVQDAVRQEETWLLQRAGGSDTAPPVHLLRELSVAVRGPSRVRSLQSDAAPEP